MQFISICKLTSIMQITSGYDLHSLSLMLLKNMLAMSAEHFKQLVYCDFKGIVCSLSEANERNKRNRSFIFSVSQL